MLWIALYLPELPLQLARRGRELSGPCVIAEGPSMHPVVCCANIVAREHGVFPGMPVAAARALAGELTILQRNEAAEAQALHNLGCWAGQFTPNVTLEAAGLLLEVGSTLRLHGGLTQLIARVRRGMAELGYRASPGVAPTPRAASMLARARQAGLRVRMCKDPALLPERLKDLPLALLDWPDETMKPLQTLGIHRIGQCLKLPSDGFIRRFGRERRLDLDKALGAVPDPRSWFTPPDAFSSRMEFGFEVSDALSLLFPLKRLLGELEGFLRGRGAGVQQLHLLLEHMKDRTCIMVGTAAPERGAERLLALARERLAQTALPAPVLALGLKAGHLLNFEESSQSLISDPRSRAIGWGQLIDKLNARLGSDRIHRLQALDDHRPEHAWKKLKAAAPADKSPMPKARAPRPLWLLNPPRVLSIEDGEPLCPGRLRMLSGPERIEAGWWDGHGARRDYYVARNLQGETLWIYREHRRDDNWYLHGIFA